MFRYRAVVRSSRRTDRRTLGDYMETPTGHLGGLGNRAKLSRLVQI
jgi:hypothetical protein